MRYVRYVRTLWTSSPDELDWAGKGAQCALLLTVFAAVAAAYSFFVAAFFF